MNRTVKTKSGTELPLLTLSGKPYLQVPWRIVWLREEHPEWIFEASFPILNEKFVMAKAQILDENGKLKAVAHKVEHFAHFTDAAEKAETGAIGRALGMLGYGTQFAIDLEENRLADAPLEYKNTVENPVNSKSSIQNNTLSEAQLKRFWAMSKALNWSIEDSMNRVKNDFKKEHPDKLSREEYTLLTSKMQVEINNNKTPF